MAERLSDVFLIHILLVALYQRLNEWTAFPLPLGEGEGRRSMQILRPSPCPLPEGEGFVQFPDSPLESIDQVFD